MPENGQKHAKPHPEHPISIHDQQSLSVTSNEQLVGNELFRAVPAALMQDICQAGRERDVAVGELVLRQGERGEHLFVILSGSVRLFAAAEEGTESVQIDLGAGDSFGETVLLTGEPQPASARTLTPARLLLVPRADFERLMTTVPDFSAVLARRLSRRLVRATSDLARAADTEKAYQRFVTQHGGGSVMAVVGRSESAQLLHAAIERLASGMAPVLVTGPVGTEMHAVAWKVHQSGRAPDAPFLVMDAQTVTFIRAGLATDPRHPFQLELAQDYTLFGLKPGGLLLGAEHALGLLQVGQGGTVVIVNAECLAECVQARLADYLRDGFFYPFGGLEPVTSTARIIALTSADLARQVAAGHFAPPLLTHLAPNTLTLKALRARKKDLPLLFEALIAQCARQAGKEISGLEQHAFNDLMAYDWPGNTDELEVVIRRAVNLAQGRLIMPEDIFIGPSPAAGPAFNLLKFDALGKVLRHWAYPGALQVVTSIFFVLILYLGFFATVAPEDNIGLPLAWALWEPLVFWGTLFTARFWCAACPIGGASALISKHFSLQRQVPPFLRQYGIYLSALGVGTILWLGEAAGMPHNPRATAMLILSILVPGLLLSLVYQRRSWCRFLCPLGSMTGYFSSVSGLELRGCTATCNNDCKTHACYKGAANLDGCPMFEGPFALHANQNCTLCGACVKACTHSAPVLNLRPPGRELWTVDQPSRALAVLVPVIAGSQLYRGGAEAGFLRLSEASGFMHWGGLAAALILATVAVFLLLRLAGAYVFRALQLPLAQKAGFIAHAFVPLTAGFELAYQLAHLLNGAGHFLTLFTRMVGFSGGVFGPVAAPWALTLVQLLLCLVGAAMGLTVLRILALRICGRSESPALPPLWFWPVGLLAIVYCRLFLPV